MATKSEGYEAYRQAQLEDGLLFQDFVVTIAWDIGLAIAQYASKAYQLAVGESRGGFEIKHDKKRAEKGNLYIETAEKARPRPGDYAPAGIMRNGHWLYLIGDYDVLYIFPTVTLRALFAQTRASGQPRYQRVETPTSRGFLLPEKVAVNCAARILRPAAGGKVTQMAGEIAATVKQIQALLNTVPNQLRLFENQESGS